MVVSDVVVVAPVLVEAVVAERACATTSVTVEPGASFEPAAGDCSRTVPGFCVLAVGVTAGCSSSCWSVVRAATTFWPINRGIFLFLAVAGTGVPAEVVTTVVVVSLDLSRCVRK